MFTLTLEILINGLMLDLLLALHGTVCIKGNDC